MVVKHDNQGAKLQNSNESVWFQDNLAELFIQWHSSCFKCYWLVSRRNQVASKNGIIECLASNNISSLCSGQKKIGIILAVLFLSMFKDIYRTLVCAVSEKGS